MPQPARHAEKSLGLWFLAALVPAALLLLAILRFAVNVPYWDDWRWADMIIKFDEHRLTFGDLWHPQVEHRILVPSLVALGLSRVGGYNTVGECVASWLCSFVSLICLFLLLRRTIAPNAIGPALLAQSILLFSLAQLTTYLWGFQLAWTLVNALVLIVLVAFSAKRVGTREFLVALVASIAASLSSAQGLLAFPIGVSFLAVRPQGRGYVVPWLIVAAAAFLVYLPGIGFAQPNGVFSLQGQLERLGLWPIVVGAPLCGWTGIAGSAIAGLFAIAFCAIVSLRYADLVRRDASEAQAWTPWIALALFGIVGSLMIAFGRGILGMEYGLQERYLTLSSLTWIAFVPLAILWNVARPDMKRQRSLTATAAFALIALVCTAREYASGVPPAFDARARRLQQRSLVLSYRSIDEKTLVDELFPNESARAFMRTTNFPSPDDVRTLIEGLEANDEGPFRF